MRIFAFLTAGVIALSFLFSPMIPSSRAQTEEEKKFMKQHREEMTIFMEKCSGCHSLQRILAKRRSKEEWDRVLKIMAGKPHANVSNEELKKIQKWIDFMQTTIPPAP